MSGDGPVAGLLVEAAGGSRGGHASGGCRVVGALSGRSGSAVGGAGECGTGVRGRVATSGFPPACGADPAGGARVLGA